MAGGSRAVAPVEFDLSALAYVAEHLDRSRHRLYLVFLMVALVASGLALVVVLLLGDESHAPDPAFFVGELLFAIVLLVMLAQLVLGRAYHRTGEKPVLVRVEDLGVMFGYRDGRTVTYRWNEPLRVAWAVDRRSDSRLPAELQFAFERNMPPLGIVTAGRGITGPVPIPEAAFVEILRRAEKAGAKIIRSRWERLPEPLQSMAPTLFGFYPRSGIGSR